MTVYLAAIIVTLLFVVASELRGTGRLADWFYWTGFFVMSSLVAVRWGVGADYSGFYDIETLPWDELSLLPVSDDGFNRYGIVVKGLYYFSDFIEFRPLIFIVSAYSTYFLWFSVIKRYSRHRALSISVVVAFFLSPSFNAVWQLWAMAFVFYGYKYVEERRLFRFMICVFAGWAIHSSALLGLLIYPVYNWMRPKIVVAGCMIAATTGGLLWYLISSIGWYGHYAERVNEFPGGEKLRYLYPLLVCFLCAAYHFSNIIDKTDADDRRPNTYEPFVRLLAVISVGCVFPFLLGAHIGNRCGFYFVVFLTLAAPLALWRMKTIAGCASLVFCMFFFVTVYLYQRNPMVVDTHVPYRSLFSADFEHPPWDLIAP